MLNQKPGARMNALPASATPVLLARYIVSGKSYDRSLRTYTRCEEQDEH